MPESMNPTPPLGAALEGGSDQVEQLNGLDVLGFFGQEAYDTWRRDGCPPLTLSDLTDDRSTRPGPAERDERPDWAEVCRWIEEHGRGAQGAPQHEQLACGICDIPLGADATVGDALDHLRAVHEIHGVLADQLIRVRNGAVDEEACRG